ncbi:MAG TPA: L,D-transpeptidase family protein [Mesorhizobium sp.]|jgi:lipoprotein-anchoring transpeptidase ErfK/SrfK
MQLRSFIYLGFCAVLATSSAAIAGTPAGTAAPQSVAKTDVVQIAAKSDAAQLRALKKKKKPTDEDLAQIRQLEAKVATAKAEANAKALEARKLAMREAAKAKAAEAREAFLAKKGVKEKAVVAETATAKASDRKKPAILAGLTKPLEPVQVEEEDPVPAEVMNIAVTGNNGELRSEPKPGEPRQQADNGLFAGLFGGAPASPSISLLPETRALDTVLKQREAKKPFKVKPEFVPQEVEFRGYDAGTIVIDTGARRLYLVESSSTARRYAIAVGKEGLQFKGTVAVGDKQEWPRWIPTLDMQKREPQHYARYKDGMPGGGQNPLGARAIYLYDGKTDTHLRIHGTVAPQSIGTSASNGCFRMINEHVMDLYRRVKMGTKVVII